MSYRFSFIAVLSLIVIVAASCTCGGIVPQDDLPFSELPGEPQQGDVQIFFTADRTSIQPGECVNLEWHIEGEGFFGVDLNGQPVDPAGNEQVCPPETIAYTLAVDIGSTVLHREVVVDVAGTGQQPSQPQTPGQPPQPSQPPTPGCPGAPTFTHFEANPGFITTGQSTTLEWGPITNGTTGELVGSVTLAPGNFGEVGSPGSRQVSPTSTTTYTLTATGCGGTMTKSVTVVVAVIGTPIPIPTPTPPGGGGWSGPPKVTNVTVTANPYTGPCPKELAWTASITVDGPCTVTYRWERHDGATGPVETLVFGAAGTKTVTTTWMVWVGNNATYWQRVSILTPLPMLSNQADLTFTCTP